jgi:hypothetical protein
MVVIKTNNDFTISTYPEEEFSEIVADVKFILNNARNTDIKIFRENVISKDITEKVLEEVLKRN